MTAGAFTGDVAVGQECVCFFIVILHGSLFDEFAFIVQFAEKVGSCFMMYFRSSTSVNIERDTEFLE